MIRYDTLSCNPICDMRVLGLWHCINQYPFQTPNLTSIAVDESAYVQTLRARRSRETFKPGRKRCEHRISGGWTSWLRSRRLSRTGLLGVKLVAADRPTSVFRRDASRDCCRYLVLGKCIFNALNLFPNPFNAQSICVRSFFVSERTQEIQRSTIASLRSLMHLKTDFWIVFAEWSPLYAKDFIIFQP